VITLSNITPERVYAQSVEEAKAALANGLDIHPMYEDLVNVDYDDQDASVQIFFIYKARSLIEDITCFSNPIS